MTTAAEKKAAAEAATAEQAAAEAANPGGPRDLVVIRHQNKDIKTPAVVGRKAAEGVWKKTGWEIDTKTTIDEARAEINAARSA